MQAMAPQTDPLPRTPKTPRAPQTSTALEDSGETARIRWESRTQGPLLALAVLFGVAYAVPIMDTGVDPAVRRACTITEWLVWTSFAVDYMTRVYLANERWLFVRRHPFALIAVLLPLVQPLRLMRLISALLLVGHRARMTSQIQVTTYVAGSCAGLLAFGSLAVLEVERDSPGSNIHTLGDALWWAFTTMTTVGYGDTTPTTTLGRVLAVALMLSGIALLGVVTANIAAWFIARFEREDDESSAHAQAIADLTAEVRLLRSQLAGPTHPVPGPAPSSHPDATKDGPGAN
jgi:voltage-gated potassium channel